MNKSILFGALLLVLTFSASCQQNNKLLGAWIGTDEDDYFIIEFQNENVVVKTISGEVISTHLYKLDGNIIYTIDDSGNRERFGSYTNNTINIDDIIFERYQPNRSSIIGKYICTDGIITEIEILDNTNIILRGGMMGYNTALPGKYKLVQGKLIVNISGDSAIFQINKDGSLTGETYGMTEDYIKIK